MSEMATPLVSVIIPTFNREQRLKRAVESALAQTHTNLEIIVIDDASEVSPAPILDEMGDQRVSLIILGQNSGASAARNAGIAKATGSYIAFLDDDDLWEQTKIEKQLEVFDRVGSDVGMVYCWMDFVDENGEKVSTISPELRGNVFDQVLGAQRLGGCPTLIARADVARHVKGFDEALLRGNDGDFIRRVCREFAVDFVPEVLVTAATDSGPRISSVSRSSLMRDLHAHDVRFQKFGPELKRNNLARAELLRNRSISEARLGNKITAIKILLRAAVAHPFSMYNLKYFARILWVEEVQE
jgi:glycosyltransferase involved in cell wall biosynthesis